MNISGKIEPIHVSVYRDVSNATKILDIPFVVVGAAARDLVLHYGYGARIVRATTDIDFGIQVADPAAYESLVALLKIIAWTDRAANLRKKDASDLDYLMENYEKIPEIIDTIYDDLSVLERFEWNTALAGAFALGRDAN